MADEQEFRPILQPFESNASLRPAPTARRASLQFVTQVVDALVGRPGEPELAAAAGKWRNDPAALAWVALGYVAGVAEGFRKSAMSTLSIVIAGEAAAFGIVQAAVETPRRPGTVSPDNIFVRYMGEKQLIAIARQLRPLIERLANEDAVTGSQRVADALAASIILAAREERSKLIAAPTPFAFGRQLGNLSGQFAGEIAINEGLNLAERTAGAQKLAKELPELAEHYRVTIDQDVASKQALQEISDQAQQSKQAVADELPVVLESQPAVVAKQTPKREFELGDVGAISPDEPIVPIKQVLVEAPPRPAMAKLVAEVRGLPNNPQWVAQLSDEQIASIVDKAEQLVAKVEKLDKQQMAVRQPMLAGFVQESSVTLHPKFGPLKERLQAELAKDPHWNPDSLQFALVRNVEPAKNVDQRAASGALKINASAQEQELADGVFIVRARDPDARAQLLIAADFESKSWRNAADLFFEREDGAKLAQMGQIARDFERFSNTDLIFDIVAPGGAVTSIHVPAGRTAISRQTTTFILVTPRPISPEYRAVLINEIGIRPTRIEEWTPTFDRTQIDNWADALLRWAFARKK